MVVQGSIYDAIEVWSQPDEIFATDACMNGGGGWNSFSRQFFHRGVHIAGVTTWYLVHCPGGNWILVIRKHSGS